MKRSIAMLFLPLAISFSCKGKEFSREDWKQFHTAQTLYLNRKFNQSYVIAEKLAKKNPENLEATMLLVKIDFYTKKFQDAEKILRTYLDKTDGNNPYALMWLGKTLSIQKNRQKEALEVYQKIVKNDPENYLAHYYLGRELENQNKIKEAILEYQQATAMEYQLSKIHLHMGELLARLQLNDRAREHFAKVNSLGVNPHDVRIAESAAIGLK